MNKKNKKDIYTNILGDLSRSKKKEAYFKGYAAYLNKILFHLDCEEIYKVAVCFEKARDRGATIYFIGNGGSAATASHFAQDINEISRKTSARPFRALALSESISSITALANDYGYEVIFAEQLKNLLRRGDVLVAISASGNSPNILKAVEFAKGAKGVIVGLTGFDGGRLSKLCDYLIHVPTKNGEYGPAEDVHLIIDHMITTYLMFKELAKSKIIKK